MDYSQLLRESVGKDTLYGVYYYLKEASKAKDLPGMGGCMARM